MKKYFKLLVLLIICLIPINTYAYSLSCDNFTHKVGDVFSCKITGDRSTYDKLSGTITSDDAISCERASVSPGLEVLASSTNTYFSLSGTTSSNDLIVLTCKVLTNPEDTINATVSVTDFTYHESGSGVDEKSEILRSDFIKIEHKDDDTPVDDKPRDISDPSLRPRRLSSKELNITFSQFISEYSVEVLYETEQIEFDYELNDPTSTLRIEGDTSLKVGKNVIDVYITNSLGKESCYTFYIERLARGESIYYPESDSTLKSMVIPGYAINFDKDKLEYNIHLTSEVNSVNINTTTNYERATTSVSNTDNLKNGDIIVVEVTSADETSKTTYRINVTKDAPKKDYTKPILYASLGVALVLAIALFIITNNKKKTDPLLSIKTNKRKVNKGKNFDKSIVPESEKSSEILNSEESPNQINTLNLNDATITEPIQTEKVVLDSFNQVSSTSESINLNTLNTQSEQTEKTLTPQPNDNVVNNIQTNINNNQGTTPQVNNLPTEQITQNQNINNIDNQNNQNMNQ